MAWRWIHLFSTVNSITREKTMKKMTIAAITLASLVACGGGEKSSNAQDSSRNDSLMSSGILQVDTQSYVVKADIKLADENAVAGFAFRAKSLEGEDFAGYYTGLSGADKTVFLLEDDSEMARRNVSIEPQKWYSLRLEVSGNNFVFYLNDNAVAKNQFPQYDAVDDTYADGKLALRIASGKAEFRNVSVEPYERELPEVTYQNPVQAGCADP